MTEPLLRMENVTKIFPGVRALDGVSVSLGAGSVHALMGENGAGKSTLMKCLFGVYTPDGGEFFLEGQRVSFENPRAALDGGVAMVHQELNQALKLTVAENIWLGRFPRLHPRLPFIDSTAMRRRTAELFKELGLDIDPDKRMEELSVSERQMAEIAKAVSYDARVVVFDEPTSSLTEKEAERLFSVIGDLKKKGCGIFYISHKMAEILRICDTVTVMRDGKRVSTDAASELTTDRLISLMVGRELTERYPKRKSRIGSALLEVRGLSGEYNRLTDASLTLRRGEILGIAGLEGSGRTELVETIFGLSTPKSGEIRLEGRSISNKSPGAAIRNGFALVTEERRATGIFGILDLTENTVISSLRKYSFGPFVKMREAEGVTDESIKRLRVKAPSRKARIQNLSGGNQQKVILARWMLTEPLVLMLDEPTRGIDIGAKYEIYALLQKLAEDGKGIIMISSEMPELIGISDRILVMSGGRIAGELTAAEATQEDIMRLAAKYAE